MHLGRKVRLTLRKNTNAQTFTKSPWLCDHWTVQVTSSRSHAVLQAGGWNWKRASKRDTKRGGGSCCAGDGTSARQNSWYSGPRKFGQVVHDWFGRPKCSIAQLWLFQFYCLSCVEESKLNDLESASDWKHTSHYVCNSGYSVRLSRFGHILDIGERSKSSNIESFPTSQKSRKQVFQFKNSHSMWQGLSELRRPTTKAG